MLAITNDFLLSESEESILIRLFFNVLTLKYTKNCCLVYYIFFELRLLFSQINPIAPERNDAINIINLELLIIWLSSKANNVIKIDIVNPIPPRKPDPNNWFQLISLGNLVSFSFIDR